MKMIKIFINCSLFLIAAMAIITFALTIDWCIGQWESYNLYFESFYYESAVVYTVIEVFCCIAVILCGTLIVLLNPSVFHISKVKEVYRDIENQRNENKVKRADEKAAMAEAKKQAQIEELERKLNELKKDE